jgi:hypothetical protein
MRTIIRTLTFLLAGFLIVVQTSQAQNLSSPDTLNKNNFPTFNGARYALTPYVQAVPNDSYTFMAFSHPSLSSAQSKIGVIVELVNMATVPDDTGGASVNFTIDAGETHRVFVVNQSHATIGVGKTGFTDSRTHVITTQDSAQFGSARITGINNIPTTPDSNDQFDNVGQLSMWGVVFIPSSGTGFYMEFIGDAQDSSITDGTANANLTATESNANSSGPARGIN